MATHSHTRRGIISAMAAAPLLALPATALAVQAGRIDAIVANYERTKQALNSSPTTITFEQEEVLAEAYSSALDAVISYRPRTHQEFVRKFVILFEGDGNPSSKVRDGLEADALRLIAH